MIVVMEAGASEEQIQNVIDKLVGLDFSVHRSTGIVHTVLGGVGPAEIVDPEEFKVLEGVKECHRIMSPYKLASRGFRPEGTIVRLSRQGVPELEIGGPRVVVMAGPSSVESEEQVERCAEVVSRSGARVLRGGVFKPRNSPYGFQGRGEAGLRWLRFAADAHGLYVVSEVSSHTQIDLVARYADMLQVSSRNMQNYDLLQAIGETQLPVLLKRGSAATIDDLLLAAEEVLSRGNARIVLCERGIRTFDPDARATLDIAAIPTVHKLSHLPVIADPSHSSGLRDRVIPIARAAVAAGADGLMIEVHPDPDRAFNDGAQSLRPEQFEALMTQLRVIAPAVERTI